jgi:hypothetical protein
VVSAHAPFNPRLAIGLVVAGLIAFGTFLYLLAYSPPLGAMREGRAHALSGAAIGYRALVQVARIDWQTRVVRDREDHWSEDLLVVTWEHRTDPVELETLLAGRENLPTLLILPKWVTQADPRRQGFVRRIAQMPAEKDRALGFAHGPAPHPVTGRALGRGELQGLAWPVPAAPRVISGEGAEPLIVLPTGDALMVKMPERPLYVLAEPDLLNNHGLANEGAARNAAALLRRLNSTGASTVNFDVTMNGLGLSKRPGLLRLAFEPPFLAMTLALVAAALLAGWYGAVRFGAPQPSRRAIPLGKAALVENSAGLVRLAGRETRLADAYVDVVRQEAARAAAAPAALRGDALDAYLDRIGPAGSPAFTRLAAALAAAPDRAAMLAAARALHDWKKDMIR